VVGDPDNEVHHRLSKTKQKALSQQGQQSNFVESFQFMYKDKFQPSNKTTF